MTYWHGDEEEGGGSANSGKANPVLIHIQTSVSLWVTSIDPTKQVGVVENDPLAQNRNIGGQRHAVVFSNECLGIMILACNDMKKKKCK